MPVRHPALNLDDAGQGVGPASARTWHMVRADCGNVSSLPAGPSARAEIRASRLSSTCRRRTPFLAARLQITDRWSARLLSRHSRPSKGRRALRPPGSVLAPDRDAAALSAPMPRMLVGGQAILRLDRSLLRRLRRFDAACLRYPIPSLLDALPGSGSCALRAGKLAFGCVASRHSLAEFLSSRGELTLPFTQEFAVCLLQLFLPVDQPVSFCLQEADLIRQIAVERSFVRECTPSCQSVNSQDQIERDSTCRRPSKKQLEFPA